MNVSAALRTDSVETPLDLISNRPDTTSPSDAAEMIQLLPRIGRSVKPGASPFDVQSFDQQ